MPRRNQLQRAIPLMAIALILARLPLAAQLAESRIASLGAPVEVAFDTYDIPHIYAQSSEDAYRALGWIHTSNRLMEMVILRGVSSGTVAEILGAEGVESDILMRRLGIRRTSEEAWKSGQLGLRAESALKAYCEGVNAKLDALGKDGMPVMLKFLGVKVKPWEPVDCITFSKYMGWDQSGTDSDLWFGMMVEKLGAEAANELWPLNRPYELPTVPGWAPDTEPKKTAMDAGPSKDMTALAKLAGTEMQFDLRALMDKLYASAFFKDATAFGSNNWVISGAKSATGHPILANDPHLGFKIPSLWYTAHLSAPGLNVTGVTFPGSPFAVIGHNDRIAWGITNMQADAVDYFIETINPDNPKQYKHKGEWKDLTERTETLNVRGEQPREIVIQSTLHGPIEKSGDRTVALAWTALGMTLEMRAIAEFNNARNLDDFREALDYLDVPALNMVYADIEGNIAIAPHGDLPLRASGFGRVPVDGASGDFDWVGWIPDDDLPISINPDRGWLASANGRPAPLGYPHHLGWMWDPSYRTRRISKLLAGKDKISFEDMQAFQNDSGDECAAAFVPVLLDAHKNASDFDSIYGRALEILRNWDFICRADSPATTIYNAWFQKFRSMVWEDEWKSRGIEQPGGGWGFTGDNKREPALEVLEYLARENPDSIWFDDRSTPQREHRDDIIQAAFVQAVRELSAANGDDPAQWLWGKFNILHVGALVPAPALNRGGMAFDGGPFTLNPGGDGGHVGGGASFRMLADMGDLNGALGVYPGGQSEDAKSPHYDNQIPLWVGGKYTPLWFSPGIEGLPKDAVTRREKFVK